MLLAERLVEDDTAGHGQIEAADIGIGHGDPVTALLKIFQNERREPLGFLAENQEIAWAVATFQIGFLGFFTEEVQFFQIASSQETFEVVPVNDFDMRPVVESGSFQIAVIGSEAKRVYQMEDCIGGTAKPGDAAGIGWNFRFHQHDVEGA
jgi:hypothetical protein